MPKKKQDGTIAVNRKARHDYDVLDTVEAGIVLAGTEAKSIREGAVNLKDAWCKASGRTILVKNMHVTPYEKGNIFNKDPVRDRVLLLHAREIRKLESAQARDGCALVPLDLHFSGSLVKMTVGICQGRKNYDKREAAAKRDAARDIDRAMKASRP